MHLLLVKEDVNSVYYQEDSETVDLSTKSQKMHVFS